MAIIASFTLSASSGCKYVTANINFAARNPTTVNITVTGANGQNILLNPIPSYIFSNITPSHSIVMPVDSYLIISNGIVNVTATTSLGTVIANDSVLLHCDIDCCLTKLTNELIDCSCDCAKCASSLAKAQKIFLLLNSASYAVKQASSSISLNPGASSGHLLDANSKYLKATEVCDNSCGCDC